MRRIPGKTSSILPPFHKQRVQLTITEIEKNYVRGRGSGKIKARAALGTSASILYVTKSNTL